MTKVDTDLDEDGGKLTNGEGPGRLIAPKSWKSALLKSWKEEAKG